MRELKAKPRTELGKKTNALRRAGFLPAVVYGEGMKSQSISVPYKDFEKAYKEAGESTLLKLEVEGKPYNVLIHDIKNDPLKGYPLHADFYAVRMDKVIRTKVPIEFVGESSAVKNEGGVLVKVMQELEVEALPQDLPHGLRADISALTDFESKIFVKDILLPKGVKVLAGPEEMVALVEPPRSEEELAALAQAPVAEAPEEVKTEQELKREAKGEENVVEETGGKTETKKV
ncbi:MAG: 50S ribosomal protein L25 [Candidatus Sungbacteria bacterium]|nr:50S ribosomal protein L25 [Candidatus Sungbacteria bacterium]